MAKIKSERQEILTKAKQEAQRLIADANKQIENTIRTIREAQAEKELTRLARRELDDFRDAVEQADTAEKDAQVAREIERIERRRQRRIERKTQRGEAQAAAAAPEPPKPREVETGSKVRMVGQDMVGVGSVSILHGKGTGALKEEIRRYLRTVPEVESAKDEHADRGGAGITIVTFKMD